MGDHVGVKYILDLDACLYFDGAGANLLNALFKKSQEVRVGITSASFKEVKLLSPTLAKKIKSSKIEIIEFDESIFHAAESLTSLIVLRGVNNAVVNEKVMDMASVFCAQNGAKPACSLVTGDKGISVSSTEKLCLLTKTSYVLVEDFL